MSAIRKLKRDRAHFVGGSAESRVDFRHVHTDTLSKNDEWLKHPSFVKRVLPPPKPDSESK